jgi:4-amino-4-deoxy-L-arabinose transferase-like glycosyltransferase
MVDRLARFLLNLKFIIILSVLLRVGAALYLGDAAISLPGTADQVSYHNLAIRVLEGHGFSFDKAWWPMTGAGEPTAHWSFLYTLYLVFCYSFFGINPLAARIIQAILVGVLHPYLAYRLADAAFGGIKLVTEELRRRTALFAALITGIYIYFIYYSVTLMTEPFFIASVMATLLASILLAQRISEPGYWRLAILLGLSIALSVLLRQLFLLFVPILFIWLLVKIIKRVQWKRAVISSLIVGVVLLLAILPVTYYNYLRFHRFVLVNTNAGYVLFWANHPIHGTNFISAAEMGDTYQELVPEELKSLDEAALDQELLRRGIQFILDEPGRYALLSLSRIPAFFKFWPDPGSGMLSNISRVGSFGVLLPFILLGLIRSLSYLRWSTNRSILSVLATPLALLDLFIFAFTFIHIFTWALVRYRLPVDAILVVYAGLTFAELSCYLQLRRDRKRGISKRSAIISDLTPG